MNRNIFLCVFFCFSVQFLGSAEKTWDKKYAEGKLHFLVANDTGRNGYYDQPQIAEIMGEYATDLRPMGVLSPGDIHHFEGIQSIMDPLWLTNFEMVYKHPDLMIEWYPVCGNHEYRGNPDAMIEYSNISRRWEMPARYYSKTFSKKGVKMKVIFIDTTPLIDINRNIEEGYGDASIQNIEEQLNWLENVLAEPTDADWTVVVGHHPIYADSPKRAEEQTDLQTRLDPYLRKYNIDMYICGHIHNFQHIRKEGTDIDYILNSSASQAREEVKEVDGTQFCQGITGFGILSVGKDKLQYHMIDKNGNLINTVERIKQKL